MISVKKGDDCLAQNGRYIVASAVIRGNVFNRTLTVHAVAVAALIFLY